MVIYGKTIANGIPMSAIVGKKNIMECALKTFISSVFWSEKVGPASALAFIKKHKNYTKQYKTIKKCKSVSQVHAKHLKK